MPHAQVHSTKVLQSGSNKIVPRHQTYGNFDPALDVRCRAASRCMRRNHLKKYKAEELVNSTSITSTASSRQHNKQHLFFSLDSFQPILQRLQHERFRLSGVHAP